MEVIKSENITAERYLTLIKSDESETYEIQLTAPNEIIKFEGEYNKKEALTQYKTILNNFKRQYIVITNFINYFASNEDERKQMTRAAEDYLWEED